ncbi:MAG TPA: hypothetical protein VK499_15665 [Propionibacteriaceae bacterium]|jgi:hypothetical protein|nr:hypothetical protein [Propionibacteriaceae bacterium]
MPDELAALGRYIDVPVLQAEPGTPCTRARLGLIGPARSRWLDKPEPPASSR